MLVTAGRSVNVSVMVIFAPGARSVIVFGVGVMVAVGEMLRTVTGPLIVVVPVFFKMTFMVLLFVSDVGIFPVQSKVAGASGISSPASVYRA